MSSNSRILHFDILRAIAIILVLLNHIPAKYIGDSLAAEFFWSFKRGGWSGVDMFFVLSGFLVSGIYFREYKKSGKISIGNFLIRRGFKIYPNFYFLIFITIITFWFVGIPIKTNDLVGELLFVQNYVGSIWSPTWSLAVEEHFYILLTIIFFIFKLTREQNTFKYLPVVFVVIAIICFILRVLANIKTPDYDFNKLFGMTHLRIDALMFGVLIAYYYYFKPQKLQFIEKRKYMFLTISAIMLAPYFLISREFFDQFDKIPNLISIFGLSHLYLLFGVTLIAFWNVPMPKNIFTNTLGLIGRGSYAIYLWHVPIIFFLEGVSEKVWVVPAYLLLSIVWGHLLTYIIEIPFLKLRDKIFPSKSGMIKRRNFESKG